MPTSRALVIEDDDFVRGLVVQQLRTLGIAHIDEAADGSAARRALEGGKPYKLILADLMLPGADTVEILRTSGSRQANAGLILMSALGEGVLRSVAVLCRERGQRVLGALRKPLKVESIGELIRRAEQPAAHKSTDTHQLPDAGALARALEQRTIVARVQPMIDAQGGGLHSVEVFAHWEDARYGVISPRLLVRLADEAGLGSALMRYMMSLALRTCADWKATGFHVPVAVNLGNRLLHDLQIPEFLQQMLKTLDLQPEQLTVEVGEHAVLDQADALDVLSRLRMRGIQVALDNFGTGQASALRMQRLPVNELKIDPSFVRCLPGGAVALAVVEYGVRLARSLGIQTTAVGVESEEQAEILRRFGCDRLQGYWLARPMPSADLPDWAASRRAMAKPVAVDGI